jgi:F0F1-type ATP synthase membrane subunit c/vacuolar-type H+-ATPase subunit K
VADVGDFGERVESMSDEAWLEDAGKSTRTLQVIVAAICMGVVMFLGIALLVVLSANGAAQANPAAQPLPVSLTLIAAIVVVVGLFAGVIAKWAVTKRAQRQLVADRSASSLGDRKSLLKLLVTRTIIGAALTEGVALLAIIAYMIEKSPISLGLSVFLLLVIASHFPTRSRVVSWVEREVEGLEMARGMGGR